MSPLRDVDRRVALDRRLVILRASTARVAAAAERHGTWLFVAISLLYWGIGLVLAQRKLFWNDELYTYYVATQPTLSDVWGALLAGGEQTPPLFYVVTRAAVALFGRGHLAFRLPELLGFWLMCACLFLIVSRRAGRVPGLLAAAVPLVTFAFPYAYEARPYALVLGSAALAFLAWQALDTARVRAAALALFFLALAAAVSFHYYGVFVLVPFALGEGVRTLARRRVDLAAWLALPAALVPLAIHVPLLRAGASYSGTFWSPPQWVNLPDFYADLATPAVVPMLAVLTVAALATLVLPTPATETPRQDVPPGDLAVTLGFIALPVVAVVTAKLVTGAFVNRYAMASVIGFAVLAGFAGAAGGRRRPALVTAAVAVIVGWFVLSQARELLMPTYSQPVSAESIRRPSRWLAQTGGSDRLPLVIADPHTFAVLSHYGDTALKDRIVYAADPERALRHLGHNSVERGMLDLLGPWFHMRVVQFEPFLDEHPQFLVYGDFVRLAFLNWLLPELRARAWDVQLLNRAGDTMLLRVTAPRAGGAGGTP